jgi:hypothetical protein
MCSCILEWLLSPIMIWKMQYVQNHSHRWSFGNLLGRYSFCQRALYFLWAASCIVCLNSITDLHLYQPAGTEDIWFLGSVPSIIHLLEVLQFTVTIKQLLEVLLWWPSYKLCFVVIIDPAAVDQNNSMPLFPLLRCCCTNFVGVEMFEKWL